MNSITIFRDYMGEDITPSCVKRLIKAPKEHIGALIQLLSPYYYDWLENEEASTHDTADTQTVSNDYRESTYYCIDPLDYERTWREKLEIYKKYLLYFPRFILPDPVAEFLYPHVVVASITSQISPTEGGLIVDSKFRRDFQDALLLLAQLAPAVLKNDVVLIPKTHATVNKVVQDGASKELETIERDEEYWNPLYQLASQYETDQGGTKSLVEEVKVDGQLCARLELTPVAGHELIHTILRQDYSRATHCVPTTNKVHRVAQTLLRYDVPGLKKVSFERAVVLRDNEDAFHEWRKAFGNVIDKAQSAQPINEKQFESEFLEAVDELLTPRIEELEKATKSSFLEKILVPASMTLGAGAVAFNLAGLDTFPPTAVAGAALAPISWVIDKVRKRFNRAGRKATILQEFYGYLFEKNP
jgi:hypothetical protein